MKDIQPLGDDNSKLFQIRFDITEQQIDSTDHIDFRYAASFSNPTMTPNSAHDVWKLSDKSKSVFMDRE